VSLEDAFLADILTNRDEDLPRLAYADWLEENGRAERAEFIRVQIELKRLPADDSRRDDLLTREGELRERLEETWTPTPALDRRFIHFDRGLLDSAWLCNLGLTSEDIASLLAHPYLTGLRALDLAYNRIGPAGARRLAESSALVGLITLNLNGLSDEPGNDIGDEGLAALARSPHLHRLQFLRLDSNRIGPQGARALAESPNAAGLIELSLGDNKLGDDGVRILVDSPSLGNLNSLDLFNTGITSAGVHALASSPHMANLVVLTLGSGAQYANNLGDRSAESLASSAAVKKLRCLDVAFCGLTTAGIEALVSSPNLSELETLHLSWNEIDNRAMRALARSSSLRKLTALRLRSNAFDIEGLRDLTISPLVGQLLVLDLHGNHLGGRALELLADSPAGSSLNELDLSANALHSEDMRFLERWRPGRLETLTLSSNPIGDEGVLRLTRMPWLRQLHKLELGRIDLSSAGAQALIDCPYLDQITTINLTSNDLGDAAERLRNHFGERVWV
jgi:uncharacterized protein (TIGR02996 family)